MNKGRMPVRACGPFLLAIALCGCADRTKPSAEDNRQLDNAADMLDAAPGTLANIDENALEPVANNTAATDESAR